MGFEVEAQSIAGHGDVEEVGLFGAGAAGEEPLPVALQQGDVLVGPVGRGPGRGVSGRQPAVP
jgi:hypothetical protein